MEFLSEYGLFLAKTLTLVVAIVFVLVIVIANANRQKGEAKPKGHLVVSKLNEELDELKEDLREFILDEDTLKAEAKAAKKKAKADKKAKQNEETPERKRIFVATFDGDTAASAVEELRHIITAVLQVGRANNDEFMLRLESPGGMVHGYGLAASQLVRLRQHGIALTVCVDKVAASGGYMMACIANRLLAAPFAYIGSIGVLVQLPNIHRLLKDNKVDFELITAGEYKRTLTTFGENTEADRAKVQEEVDEMHRLFKDFIHEHRPALDLEKVATGEVWSGTQALERGLIDELNTSDEWMLSQCKDADVYEISWEHKRKLTEKLSSLLEGSVRKTLQSTLNQWLRRAEKEKFYS